MHRKIVGFLCVLFITASYYEIGDDGSYESEVIIVVIVVISLLAFLLPSSFRIGHLSLYLDLPSLRPLPLHLLSFCLQHLLNLVRLHSLYQPLVSLLPFSHFHTRQSLLLSLSFLLFRPILMLNYIHLYLRISFHRMCVIKSKAIASTIITISRDLEVNDDNNYNNNFSDESFNKSKTNNSISTSISKSECYFCSPTRSCFVKLAESQ